MYCNCLLSINIDVIFVHATKYLWNIISSFFLLHATLIKIILKCQEYLQYIYKEDLKDAVQVSA